MASQELSSEKHETLQDVRERIHSSVSAIVALGDGGWNHGAKMMRAHAEAVRLLKVAEAELADGSNSA